MALRVGSRVTHPFTFLAAAALVYACSIAIAGMLPRLPSAAVVAVGITCDLVLVVPALYYVLLVRGRGWRAITLAPVFVLSVIAAAWVLPADRQQLLSGFEVAAVPLELGVLGWIGWRAASSLRRVRHRLREAGDDAFDAILGAAVEATGSPRAGAVLAQELASVYYAFFAWRTPLPANGFTSYRRNGYGLFLVALLMVLVIETVGVHLLVHLLWSGVAAWILSGLSLYALVWMLGDFQALRLRTTTVGSDSISLRLGTRWQVEIPRDAVLAVDRLGDSRTVDDGRADRPLNLVLLGAPDVELRLSRPVTARGVFGIRRTTTRIRLQLDDPPGFVAEVLASSG